MHARRLWDPAEHLANGHVDPQPCFACRLEWPVEGRPPNLAKLGGVQKWGVPCSLPSFLRKVSPAWIQSITGRLAPTTRSS